MNTPEPSSNTHHHPYLIALLVLCMGAIAMAVILDAPSAIVVGLLIACNLCAIALLHATKAAAAEIRYLRWKLSERQDTSVYEKAVDDALHERNRVVALLARLFPSGKARTNIEGWDPLWHGCVYIDLPAGQISYHFHDRDAYLFEALPPYQGEWDGHTKERVHWRLSAHSTLKALIPVSWVRHWSTQRAYLAHRSFDVRAEEVANLILHDDELNKALTAYQDQRTARTLVPEIDWDVSRRSMRQSLFGGAPARM